MSARNIIIYTIHPDEWPCEYCDRAKDWLDGYGYDYSELPLFTEERNDFYDLLGLTGKQRTMPQIFIDGERIGGYAELIEMEDL